MRLVRLFHASPQLGQNWLDEAAAHKVSKVLRMRVGDAVELVCGDGRNYQGAIAVMSKQAVAVEVQAVVDSVCTPTLPLHLYLALLKGEPWDWALQKAVELGVTQIVPLMTERSERVFTDERWAKKAAHWQGILQASALQCGRADFPQLSAPQSLLDAQGKAIAAPCAVNIVFSPHDGAAQDLPQQATAVALMIGPEGGLTAAEVQAAQASGWQTQLLGRRILRADTAVVAGLTAIQLQYGEFHSW